MIVGVGIIDGGGVGVVGLSCSDSMPVLRETSCFIGDSGGRSWLEADRTLRTAVSSVGGCRAGMQSASCGSFACKSLSVVWEGNSKGGDGGFKGGLTTRRILVELLAVVGVLPFTSPAAVANVIVVVLLLAVFAGDLVDVEVFSAGTCLKILGFTGDVGVSSLLRFNTALFVARVEIAIGAGCFVRAIELAVGFELSTILIGRLAVSADGSSYDEGSRLAKRKYQKPPTLP